MSWNEYFVYCATARNVPCLCSCVFVNCKYAGGKQKHSLFFVLEHSSAANADYNKSKIAVQNGTNYPVTKGAPHFSIEIAHEQRRRSIPHTRKKNRNVSENAYIKEIAQEWINLNLLRYSNGERARARIELRLIVLPLHLKQHTTAISFYWYQWIFKRWFIELFNQHKRSIIQIADFVKLSRKIK